MTSYCQRRKLPFEGSACPGRGGEARWPALPEDPCLVTELGMPWADMFREALDKRGVPCAAQPVCGAGRAVLGSWSERYRFLVRYEHLEEARALAEEMFFQNEEESEAREKEKETWE